MAKRAPLVSLAIIVLMIVNCILPRYAACPRGYNNLFLLIKNQPLLEQFQSFSSVPVAIVNKLLAGDSAGCGNRRPARQQETPVNTSADYSVVLDKNTGGNRAQEWRTVTGASIWTGMGECAWIALSLQDKRIMNYGGGGGTLEGGLLFILLGMLLAVLPRGNLDTEHISRMSIFVKCPVWLIARLGFLFGGNA